MSDKNRGFSLFFACTSGILGLGLFSLPTAAAYFGSTFFWGILLGGMLLALAANALFSLAFPDTFVCICTKQLPKVAKAICALYILFCTLIAALLFSYYAHTVQGWFLDGVARAPIALFLISICLFTAIKPAKTILRLISLTTVFVLVATIIMRTVLLVSGDMRNLLPLFEAAHLPALPEGSLFLSGFFVFLHISSGIRLPARTKLLASSGAILLCTFIFILATAGCISVLGPLQTAQHLNSTVLAMKTLSLSALDFFQRGDLVFIVTWTVLMLSAGTLGAHLPYAALRELCPTTRPVWLWLAFFIVYVITALILPSEESALLLLNYTALLGGSIFFVALPMLLLLKRGRTVEKTD